MDIRKIYPILKLQIFSHFHQDWNYEIKTISGVINEALKFVRQEPSSLEDIYEFGFGSIAQLYGEIYDIVKNKNIDEQWEIYKQLAYDGPVIESKWQAECFLTTILYLTEAEMRKRGLEIPENPPLHTAIV